MRSTDSLIAPRRASAISVIRVIRAIGVIVLLWLSLSWLNGVYAQTRVNPADLARLKQLSDQGSPAFNAELVSAIQRLDATDSPPLITELIFLFGEWRYAYGSSQAALPAVEAAFALATIIGDASMAASLDGLAGQMQFAANRMSNPARDRIMRALTAQRATGRALPLARQLSSYATLLQDINEFADAMRMSNEAVNLVEGDSSVKSGTTSSVALGVYYTHAELLRAVGDAKAALAAAEKLLTLSLQSGNQEFAGYADLALGRVFTRAGQLDRAATALESSYARAMAFADPMGQTLAALDRADVAIERSQYAVATVWSNKLAPLIATIDDPMLRARFGLQQARLLAIADQPGPARRALDRAKSAMVNDEQLWLKALLRTAEAEVLASEGKSVASLQLMREAAQLNTESDRLTLRDVVAAQGDLYRLNERESREKQMAQESRLREAQLDAAEQRVLTQRLVVALVAVAGLVAMAAAFWQLSRAQRFRRRAEVDGLTGICSRSAIKSKALAAFGRAQRDKKPISLLIADVDGLKTVNDSRGHAEGDLLLREMSALIAASLRQQDMLGRWGGDEFVALLLDTDAKVAAEIAERIRVAVANGLAEKWAGIGACSIGGATRLADGETFEMTLARADAAMYRAKQAGKNRVVFAEV